MGHPAPSYKGHRYPVEVISHCVWLYFRFPLSYREVEELMLDPPLGDHCGVGLTQRGAC
jgi:putative transposase